MGVVSSWEKEVSLSAVNDAKQEILAAVAETAKETTAQTTLNNSADTLSVAQEMGVKIANMPSDVAAAISDLSGSKMFTANGTFVVPKGVTKVKLTGCGAGGTYYAGAYCYEEQITVPSGASVPVTVGAGNTVFGTYKTLLAANCSVSFVNQKLGYNTGYDGGDGGDGGGNKEKGDYHDYAVAWNGIGGKGGRGGAFGFGGGGGGAGGSDGVGERSSGRGGSGGGGAAGLQGSGANGSAGTSSGSGKYGGPGGSGFNSGKSGEEPSGNYDRDGGRGGDGGASNTSKGYGSGSGQSGTSATITYPEGGNPSTRASGGNGGAGGGSNGFLLIEWG